MKKEHILQEIRRTAEANGGVPVGRRAFLRETGIRESDWLGKFWVRWGEAVREAGYTPNKKTRAYDEVHLLEKYIEIAREVGQFPVEGDMRLKSHKDSGFPSSKTFLKRFGSKSALVSRLMEYCQSRPGYEDILQFCAARAAPKEESPDQREAQQEEIGFVYLMKSGGFYKVGKSNSAGRREYEVAIQLPERLRTIHTIRTDDPTGIEEYWHKRFAAKRKNGEWFDLDSKDTTAFKRRRFM